MAAITMMQTPMTSSIGRVDEPTTAKNVGSGGEAEADGDDHRSQQIPAGVMAVPVTANMSRSDQDRQVVPAMARPLTIIAMIGVATRAAPGNAVFDNPTIRAATDPRIRLPTVNTGAA